MASRGQRIANLERRITNTENAARILGGPAVRARVGGRRLSLNTRNINSLLSSGQNVTIRGAGGTSAPLFSQPGGGGIFTGKTRDRIAASVRSRGGGDAVKIFQKTSKRVGLRGNPGTVNAAIQSGTFFL